MSMYMRLFGDFWRDHRLLLIVYVLLTAAILPLESIGFSSYTSRIIGYAKGGGSLPAAKIYHCILMIAGVYLLTRGMNTIEYYLEIIIDSHLVKSVRSRMFQTYLEEYKTNYTEVEPGKMASYFSVIPGMYTEIIYRFLSRVLPYTISIIAVVGYFFYVDWRLGAAFTGMILLLVIILKCTLHTCIRVNVEKQKAFYENNDNIADRMSNLFSILVNNEDRREIEKNTAREEDFRKRMITADLGYLKVESLVNVVLLITVVVVLILYMELFRTRRKSAIVLASFLVVFQLVGYVDRVKWHFIDLVNKLGMVKSFEETNFKEEEEKGHEEGAKDEEDEEELRAEMEGEETTHLFSQKRNRVKRIGKGTKRDFLTKGHIRLEGVGFSYGEKVIHTDLHMDFTPNRIHIIKGHSGRGKTTIIKLILGFHHLNKGTITIDGVDLTDADIEYVRDQVSVVNQDARLFNESIMYNIMYGNEKTATEAEVYAKVRELGLDKTVFHNIPPKLDKRAGTNGSHLSNGQRQTVLLLRAFLNKRPILIFDEPTAALDATTKQTVLGIMERMGEGRTTIIITHDTLKIKAQIHQV